MNNREVLADFIEFNPVKFLKDSKKWSAKLKEIEDEISSLIELPSIEGSGVQTSNISDMTYNLALRRIKLDNERSYYLKAIAIKDWALANLSAHDRELIEGFFYPKTSIYRFVDDYGRKYALCTSDVYSARREALENFTELLTAKYGL